MPLPTGFKKKSGSSEGRSRRTSIRRKPPSSYPPSKQPIPNSVDEEERHRNYLASARSAPATSTSPRTEEDSATQRSGTTHATYPYSLATNPSEDHGRAMRHRPYLPLPPPSPPYLLRRFE